MRIKEFMNPDWGKAFKRISKAFHSNFNKIEWVDTNEDIELVHIVGTAEVDYLLKKDSLSNVVIVQHCFRTAGVDSQETWNSLWKNCRLVISFHNLPKFTDTKFNFIRTPWGADPSMFPVSTDHRIVKVFATGHVAGTEKLDSIFEACQLTNNIMYHTGENFKFNPKTYQFFDYMDNKEYSAMLTYVQYVAGLREIEGFEMACIEGAMTGATPIVPTENSYDFYNPFAIKVDTNTDVVPQLVKIFSEPYIPLGLDKILYVRNTFDWKVLCPPIQKAILNS